MPPNEISIHSPCLWAWGTPSWRSRDEVSPRSTRTSRRDFLSWARSWPRTWATSTCWGTRACTRDASKYSPPDVEQQDVGTRQAPAPRRHPHRVRVRGRGAQQQDQDIQNQWGLLCRASAPPLLQMCGRCPGEGHQVSRRAPQSEAPWARQGGMWPVQVRGHLLKRQEEGRLPRVEVPRQQGQNTMVQGQVLGQSSTWRGHSCQSPVQVHRALRTRSQNWTWGLWRCHHWTEVWGKFPYG